MGEDVRVVSYPFQWRGVDGKPEGDLIDGLFGEFLTEEAYISFVDGLASNDPEWVALDEKVLYWIHAYDGEKFRDLSWEEEDIADFVIDMREEY
jgi:hypothetical protein